MTPLRHPPAPLSRLLFLLLLLLPGLLLGQTAWAQAPEDVAEVRALEREVEPLRRETDADGDRTMDERRALVVRARAVLEKAELLRSTLAAPATQIEQRIDQLGKDAARSPDPAVREQHLELTRELTAHVALSRQPARPAWRLWPLGDATAALGARAGNALAAAIALVVAVEATIDLLKPGPPATVLMASALALVSTAQIAYGLYRIDGMRRIDEGWTGADGAAWRARVALWAGLGWLALAVLALFGVFGYVNLANRLSQWAIWGTVVLLVTFILMAFVDGLCKLLATAGARPGPDGSSGLALQQAAVLISAVGRLLLLALACGALLVPFGAGFTSVLSLLRPLATGFEIGGVSISAVALLRALLAFVVVVLLIRFIRSWMTKSYFPTTTLQPDARDSIDKIVRYAGVVLGILWGLTAFGVGMEKVAILASALSVGIGFGLQAITQNFVSGLILLVERPVRIGDWVKVNDVEGDIRRINVRSTEIRVGDHSTMIVPNSELITKVVQNKTMGQSLGRAQILLSVPLEADLDQAIETIAATLAADDDVLKSPAPAVFLDRVEGGMAVLNCFVHVQSPRVAYAVRSRVILVALRALRSRGILGTLPAQQFVPSAATPA